MPETFAENWVDETIKSAEFYETVLADAKPDDSFGWGARLQYLCGGRPADRPAGLLITGPAGCGKRTAAVFAAKQLLSDGYLCVCLSGYSLNEDGEAFPVLRERLNALLDRCYDDERGLCLLLEAPDAYAFAGSLYAFLGKTCYEYRKAGEAYPPLFVVLLSAEEPALPAFLREQLLLCRMSLPTKAQRDAFLINNAAGLQKAVSADLLCEETEGFTYALLADCVKNLELLADAGNLTAISEEEARAFLRSQQPPRTAAQAQEDFLDRLEQIFRKLPRQLGALRVQSGNGETEKFDALDVLSEQDKPESLRRQEFEKMPVQQLAREVFGEDSALLNVI